MANLYEKLDDYIQKEDRTTPGVLIRYTQFARDLGVISPDSNQPNVITVSPNAGVLANSVLEALRARGELRVDT